MRASPGVATSASATPLFPNSGSPHPANIVQVRGGCGWALHPNRWGHRVPDRWGTGTGHIGGNTATTAVTTIGPIGAAAIGTATDTARPELGGEADRLKQGGVPAVQHMSWCEGTPVFNSC